ncbi:uncharacterized protein LOC110227768 [Arabidopsis lyrata subsp. lyrata]|uniref:uncharacterized protein LOC110227768 n=1 Tax=Arabidopsis lyrata subsp. lyrata TaxID=81972 RepID=UPI000A29C90E|nr:uncharacterized protein LOC110227768 [Arabidopsis lyrata subsp. lyrata]|eukprot:XP_020878967.1 uncharacterized protein LOC110227768 [Arabidopsis lyrata subsp. lyrata]
MSNIQKVEFEALNVSGDNYLQWALDTKIFLNSKGLGECIIDGNTASTKDRFQAIFHIRHHLADSLKNQYLTLENPLELWVALKKRYDHQKTVLLPQAKFDWKNLRFLDFKSVDAYNSELFRIVSLMKLCGDEVSDNDLLEKTLSTFHTQNIVLQQQYRAMKFTKYEDLISCLLLAEKNNELLMRNSAQRPPGSAPIPEAHQVEGAVKDTKESNYAQRDRNSGHGRVNGRGRRGNGRGNFHGNSGRGNRPNLSYGRGRGRGISKPSHSNRSTNHSPCLRCGMTNHWAKTCRTPKYLRDLYQKHGKVNPEANMVHQDDESNMVHHDDEGDFNHENDDLMDFETSDLLKGDN